MDAYIFCAAMLCENCAEKYMAEHQKPENAEDSDDWPQGPYSDGGGEADIPQHCDHCHRYLGNSLTTYGVEYVLEALEEEAEDLVEANRIMPKPGTAEASEDFASWHGSPHKAIVLKWAEDLRWYSLDPEQEARLKAACEKLA